LGITEPHQAWLRAVLAAAEPEDAWGQQVRAARAEKDDATRRAALEKLAASADVAKVPARALTGLAGQLEKVEAHASAAQLLRRTQQQYPAGFWVDTNLGLVLLRVTPPEPDEAVRFLTAAVALRPDSPGAHLNLGAALCDRKHDYDGALASFHQALELDPKFAMAHHNLGNALRGKGQVDAAIASYRTALALDPKFALAHYNLGYALSRKGQVNEALASFRQALELDPNYAEAHCNLGGILRSQGHFAQSLAAFKRGHELGMKRPGWPYPSAEWVRQAENLVAMEPKMLAFLQGEFHPKGTAELLGLAGVCQAKKLHAAGARLYRDAFAADPKLADDMKRGHRYNAACHAALAAAGQGEDAAKLDDAERARLRKQALDWLRADLALRTRQLESGQPADRTASQRALQHWQKDTDLASLRDAAALAKLSADEQQACNQLWTDVAAFVKKAEAPAKKETKP
jgi:serine/threonine-protein kinase